MFLVEVDSPETVGLAFSVDTVDPNRHVVERVSTGSGACLMHQRDRASVVGVYTATVLMPGAVEEGDELHDEGDEGVLAFDHSPRSGSWAVLDNDAVGLVIEASDLASCERIPCLLRLH